MQLLFKNNGTHHSLEGGIQRKVGIGGSLLWTQE